LERLREPAIVSIVAPAFNECDNLRTLCREIRAVLEAEDRDFEILIIDNGSTDGSLATLKMLRKEDSRIGFVSLSRNFGHQGGLIAGLEHCRGGVVISMDADLQHPPAVIADLLAQWEKGFDVVGTIRTTAPGTSRFRLILNRIFYAVFRRLMGQHMMGGQSDFRLMDRRALDALLALPETDKFLRGLASWIGFRQTSIPFEQHERATGRSKFTLAHLATFTLKGISAFSILPLRLFTITGLVIATAAVLYGLFVFLSFVLLSSDNAPAGWATLAVGVSFLGGVQLIGIGILGEYLGRTLEEVRARPAYLVREADTATVSPPAALPTDQIEQQ
jgi:glycosyltransferase involved in cell wall biosynthesis